MEKLPMKKKSKSLTGWISPDWYFCYGIRSLGELEVVCSKPIVKIQNGRKSLVKVRITITELTPKRRESK